MMTIILLPIIIFVLHLIQFEETTIFKVHSVSRSTTFVQFKEALEVYAKTGKFRI